MITVFRSWRGTIKALECPPNSGNHLAYAALPRNCEVKYKWLLMGTNGRVVKEKDFERRVTLEEQDLTVQDCFGVYSSLLPQIFQPGDP